MAATSGPVGSRPARRVIAGWAEQPLRAVAVLGRPDVILALPSMNGARSWPFGWLRKRKLEKRLGERPWRSQVLPDYVGLALDEHDRLHLLALEQGSVFLAEVKEQICEWQPGEVKVTIASDAGMWRVVEISDDAGTFVVLAPFVLPSQRAAIRLIADRTATATPSPPAPLRPGAPASAPTPPAAQRG